MSWPLSQDYNEAIQNPATSLGEPDLKKGEPAVNTFGLPIPRSGNFADVYEFRDAAGKTWALKCFTRQVAGLQERYAAIDAHLRQAGLPFTVNFRFLAEGIRIRREWYPLLKMQWVEGFTLNEFLRDNLSKTAYLEALFLMWVRLTKRLREAKIAHGDLQHGNVLLVPGSSPTKLQLKLIDYDGMWVPSLAGSPSGEIGHANYQHPLRAQRLTYGRDVDRFPHLVIACALRGLIVAGADLWRQFDNGDNLLFRESDLKEPESSTLVRTLWELGDPVLCPLLGHLMLAARQPLEQTPWLDELLQSETTLALTAAEEQAVGQSLGIEASEPPAAPAASDYWQPASAADIFAAIRAQEAEPAGVDRTSPMIWLIAAGAVLIGLGLVIGPLLLLAFSRLSRSPATAPENPPIVAPPTTRIAPSPPEVEALAVMPKLDEPPPVVAKAAQKFPPIENVWSVPGQAAPRCLDFSRDGRQIMTSPGNSAALIPFAIFDGKKGRPIETDDFTIRAVACGADNLVLIGGMDDGAVWDLSGRKFVRSVAIADADFSALSVSPEGKDALCPGKLPGRFMRIGLDVGMTTGTWRINSDEKIVDVRFAADGKSAAAVDEAFQIFVLDLVNDEQSSWPDPSRTARAARLSPDKRLLLTFGKGNDLYLWDAAAKKLLRKLAGHGGAVIEALFTADGRILSIGADKTLRAWDVATGEQIEKIDLPEAASCLRRSPDGRLAATASARGADAAIQLWRVTK